MEKKLIDMEGEPNRINWVITDSSENNNIPLEQAT